MTKKRVIISIISLATVASLGLAETVYAFKNDDSTVLNTTISEAKTDSSDNSDSSESTNSGDLSKQETVYVFTDKSGKTNKVLASEWLKNVSGSGKIDDESILSNITNVKGDETFENNDGKLTWNTDNEDIYYQGETDKELPVGVKFTYKLDGKEISGDELEGKSGNVSILIEYTNNAKETVTINGKKEEMYVPFLMATGLMLDGEKFSDVEVNGGKLVSDGNKYVIVGYGVPKLCEDLKLDDDIGINDSFEITANTTDFTLDTAYTVATSEIFSDVNDDINTDDNSLDDLDGLEDKISLLEKSTDELVNGSKDLSEGIDSLDENMTKFVAGINQLTAGCTSLDNGIDSAKAGVSKINAGVSDLQAGVATLDTGLQTLASQNDKLNGGADAVFNTLLATCNQQIQAAGIDNITLTSDNYAATLNGLIATLKKKGVDTTSLTQMKTQLDQYNEFYKGLAAYTAGVESAEKGSAQLKAGTATLSTAGQSLEAGLNEISKGSKTLSAGMNEINTNSAALSDGVKQLDAGATALMNGMAKYKAEGINKITSVLNGNLSGIGDRYEALKKLSYNSYAGKNDDVNGSVKFIFKMS